MLVLAKVLILKYNVRLPCNVLERRRQEVRQREVEDPVRCRAETDTLGAVLEREDFTAVDPSGWCPGQAVDTGKYVGESDDGLAWGACDRELEVFIAEDVVDGLAVGCHYAGSG